MLLVPDSHQVTASSGMATVEPSISVCDAPCKSHFFITDGRVKWLPAFSEAMANSVMRHQIERHVDRDAKPMSWLRKLKAAGARLRKASVRSRLLTAHRLRVVDRQSAVSHAHANDSSGHRQLLRHPGRLDVQLWQGECSASRRAAQRFALRQTLMTLDL